jgi:pyrroloquinoline quinone biosynthesis protein B
MAHQPISGDSGSLQALRDVAVSRRIYTHLNNTNPVLDPSSPQHTHVVAEGWEVAVDGMQLHVE